MTNVPVVADVGVVVSVLTVLTIGVVKGVDVRVVTVDSDTVVPVVGDSVVNVVGVVVLSAMHRIDNILMSLIRFRIHISFKACRCGGVIRLDLLNH